MDHRTPFLNSLNQLECCRFTKISVLDCPISSREHQRT
ncbi:unnamed protein product [Arabidopsis halleri]